MNATYCVNRFYFPMINIIGETSFRAFLGFSYIAHFSFFCHASHKEAVHKAGIGRKKLFAKENDPGPKYSRLVFLRLVESKRPPGKNREVS